MDERTLSFSYNNYVKVLQGLYKDVKLPYFDSNYNVISEPHFDEFGHQLGKHHIREDTVDSLNKPEVAKLNPAEYQQPENLVWCSPNEHTVLHYMIFRESSGELSRYYLYCSFKANLIYAVQHNCKSNLKSYWYIFRDLVTQHYDLLLLFNTNTINCFKQIAALPNPDIDAIKRIGTSYFKF